MLTWDESEEERLDREASEFAKRVMKRVQEKREREAQRLNDAIAQEMAWQEQMAFSRDARMKVMALIYDTLGHRTREVPEGQDLAHAGTIGRWT